MRSSRELDSESLPEMSPEHFQAQFSIKPHPDANCQVVDTGSSGGAVKQATVTRDDDSYSTCCAEVTDENATQRLLDGPITAHCICPIFSCHDCIASIESVEGGELIVSLALPDRDELVSIVSSLREVGATPRLLQITGSGNGSNGRVIELEANSVTDKQREAVRMAVDLGYYETPRGANLGDLAARLEISRSAVSQRLKAVESKLITTFYDVDR